MGNLFVFIVFCVFALLMLALGAAMLRGHCAGVIAGYNTLPAEEKEQFDEKALTRFVGKEMFVLAALFFLWGLGDFLAIRWLSAAAMVLFLAGVVCGVAWANTGGRFRRQP